MDERTVTTLAMSPEHVALAEHVKGNIDRLGDMTNDERAAFLISITDLVYHELRFSQTMKRTKA